MLARECAGRSIRVNAVAPGVIDTPMVAQVSEKARNQLQSSIALGRLGRLDEVAAAVLFLCSPMAELHHRPRPRGRWWVPGLSEIGILEQPAACALPPDRTLAV